MSLDASKVINVTPRYARLRAGVNGSAKAKGQIIGWENIELISDRSFDTMLNEFKKLKEEFPDRILIASIMEEYNKAAWEELIDRVEQTGVVSNFFGFILYIFAFDAYFFCFLFLGYLKLVKLFIRMP